VIHRHGDRSPITPLLDEDYWRGLLVPKDIAAKIAENTRLIEGPSGRQHSAKGRGPYGRLSELGLLQMIQVGTTLRERFVTEKSLDEDDSDDTPFLFYRERPLHPSLLRIYSTDFERTIQSVQGVLVGLFPDGLQDPIDIDTRHTNWMIPDPQPRHTEEQHDLERQLATRPHILAREQELQSLAIQATQALQPLLAPDAHDISFGVDGEHPGDVEIEVEPLAWNQLAEITKCLQVRERLPPEITDADVEIIMKHCAWRWMENLRVPRLAHLAMGKLARTQLQSFLRSEEPLLTLWSAHDSTLIGMLCIYRLEQPTEWPEYASYLIMELLEATDSETRDLVVRFSLNGQVLRSEWDGEKHDVIPLSTLIRKLEAEPSSLDETVTK
jgi:acid phosphatase